MTQGMENFVVIDLSTVMATAAIKGLTRQRDVSAGITTGKHLYWLSAFQLAHEYTSLAKYRFHPEP